MALDPLQEVDLVAGHLLQQYYWINGPWSSPGGWSRCWSPPTTTILLDQWPLILSRRLISLLVTSYNNIIGSMALDPLQEVDLVAGHLLQQYYWINGPWSSPGGWSRCWSPPTTILLDQWPLILSRRLISLLVTSYNNIIGSMALDPLQEVDLVAGHLLIQYYWINGLRSSPGGWSC